MDFIIRLLKTRSEHDAIWVIVDQLIKSSNFLTIRITDPLDRLSIIYIWEIVRLHGVSMTVILERDLRFTSRFWTSLQQAMRMKLSLSIPFCPQTDR